MAEISEPSCGKCRWAKRAIGLAFDVFTAPAELRSRGATYIGAYHCEHPHQPRGLVLTTYSCPNFERPPQIESDLRVLITIGEPT